ncbi:MAG: F0F1 ATP synthase subunit delta [Firmicutes bacterium]|nr:F0F1 ATP synthase subunit delta [Bacillota bacterium]
MAELIANRYASALFDIALEKNSIDRYLEDTELICAALKDDAEFDAVLKHPQISGEEKLAVLTQAFSGKVEDDIIGLFSVAFRKNREAQLFDILNAFIDKVKEHKGIVTAKVVSARPLSEKQLADIEQKLANGMKKKVIVENSVDPALIGGLKITVCGKLIDNTVKRHLDELKGQLNNIRI